MLKKLLYSLGLFLSMLVFTAADNNNEGEDFKRTGMRKAILSDDKKNYYMEKAKNLLPAIDTSAFISGLLELDLNTFSTNANNIEKARKYRKSGKQLYPERDSVIVLNFEKPKQLTIIVDSVCQTVVNGNEVYEHIDGRVLGVEHTDVDLTFSQNCLVGTVAFINIHRQINIGCLDGKISVGIDMDMLDTTLTD